MWDRIRYDCDTAMLLLLDAEMKACTLRATTRKTRAVVTVTSTQLMCLRMHKNTESHSVRHRVCSTSLPHVVETHASNVCVSVCLSVDFHWPIVAFVSVPVYTMNTI